MLSFLLSPQEYRTGETLHELPSTLDPCIRFLVIILPGLVTVLVVGDMEGLADETKTPTYHTAGVYATNSRRNSIVQSTA